MLLKCDLACFIKSKQNIKTLKKVVFSLIIIVFSGCQNKASKKTEIEPVQTQLPPSQTDSNSTVSYEDALRAITATDTVGQQSNQEVSKSKIINQSDLNFNKKDADKALDFLVKILRAKKMLQEKDVFIVESYDTESKAFLIMHGHNLPDRVETKYWWKYYAETKRIVNDFDSSILN